MDKKERKPSPDIVKQVVDKLEAEIDSYNRIVLVGDIDPEDLPVLASERKYLVRLLEEILNNDYSRFEEAMELAGEASTST